MSLIEWLQKGLVVWGVLFVFFLIMYKRYPKLSSGLRKLFNLFNLRKRKENNVKYSDEEKIDLIMGTINRIDDKNTVKKAIERIKEIVG